MRKDVYSGIVEQTRKFAAKWRMLLVCEGLAYVAAFAALSVILSFLSDNLFHLSPPVRGTILWLLAAILVFLLYGKVVRRLLMRITPERAAVYIESRLGDFDNKLINSLQLGKDEGHLKNEIIRALVSEANSELERRSLKKSLDFRRIRKTMSLLGGGVVVLSIYWLSFGKYFENALARFSDLAGERLPITRINLSVTPGDTTVFVGDGLDITARVVEGPLPELAQVVWRSRKKSTARMEFDGESFHYSFHNLQQSFRYRVEAEDFRSRWYEVVVGEPLRAERVDMTIAFPEAAPPRPVQ